MSQEIEEFVPQAKPRETLDILARIQVSNGDVFFPILSVVRKDNKTMYCVQHKEHCLPTPNKLSSSLGTAGGGTNYKYTKLNTKDALLLVGAIHKWEQCEHKFHLNPFTFLYTYVLMKYKIDLFDIGLFEV
jgi:hypothetical protein